MWVDPIVEEIHQIRQAYAAQFNYDLDAIYRDIKRQEQESGREFVTLPAKKPSAEVSSAGESVECIQGVGQGR